MTDCIVKRELTGARNRNRGAEVTPGCNVVGYHAPQVDKTLLIERRCFAHLEDPVAISSIT
jgi:hypothetical protein